MPHPSKKYDPSSLKNIIIQNQSWLYALAFRLYPSKEGARKATVEALANALRLSKKFPASDPSFAVDAVRKLVLFLKTKSNIKKGPLLENSLDEELNLAYKISRERRVILTSLLAALRRLSFEERLILLLRDQNHFSCEAIGQIVEESSFLVRKKLSEARLKLRSAILGPLETRQVYGL